MHLSNRKHTLDKNFLKSDEKETSIITINGSATVLIYLAQSFWMSKV